MQHNPLATGKPDPPGPEYLLMTSVCQPRDGRNAEKGRNEVGGGWWGKEEMERVESSGFFCFGGGEEELHHKGIWKQSIYKGVSFPFFSQKERETDHKQELLTLFSLVINCTLPAVLSEYTTPIQAHCSSWQKKQMKSDTNEMTELVRHVLLLIFAWSAAELCSCCPLCVWGVVVEMTLHILPFPLRFGVLVPFYWPRWDLIHSSAQSIKNLLYIQAFFF